MQCENLTTVHRVELCVYSPPIRLQQRDTIGRLPNDLSQYINCCSHNCRERNIFSELWAANALAFPLFMLQYQSRLWSLDSHLCVSIHLCYITPSLQLFGHLLGYFNRIVELLVKDHGFSSN